MKDCKADGQNPLGAPGEAGSTIVLATTRAPDGGSELQFGFGAPAPELRDAFQINQLSCVLADSRALGESGDRIYPDRPSFGNRLWAGDWQMAAAVGAPRFGDGAPNVVIVKLGGATLEQRLADPLSWANPAFLSAPAGEEGIAPLAAVLRTEIEAEAAAEAELGNSHLADLVRNASWYGVVLLRPLIGVEGLPAALSFLALDPEMATLEARYGTLSRDWLATEAIPNALSAVSGAIRYTAAEEGKPGAATLRVVTLDVVFRNSAVSSFSARVALNVPGLQPIILESRQDWPNPAKGYGFAPPEDAGSHAFAAEGDASLDIAGWIEPVLAPLWQIGGFGGLSLPSALRLEVSWQGPDLASGVPAMSLPILSLPTVGLNSVSATDVSTTIAATVADWVRVELIEARSGNLRFALSLTAHSGLLRLQLPDLLLPMERVLLP
jgi:hypothetical protein